MSSEVEPRATTSSEHNSSTIEEQQGLLQPEQPMGSNTIKPEGRRGDASAKVIIWASFAVFALSTWVIILSNDPASLGWFKFHPLFQSLSIGSFTYGILTLQPTSQPKTKAAGLQRHQIAMMCVGVPLILAGTGAILLQKNSHNAPHFTTWHGTFGILTVAWIIVQALVGGSTVWFGGAAWGGGMKAKLMWKYHRLSGYVLFPVLLFTAHLGGGWSFWSTGHSDSFVRLLAFTIAPFVILAGVYSRIRPSKMKFF
ncbi:hypothetical protein L210DRAFT_3558561 [Boletus edulis BED1]|uniref:Cytochrome b561 domain-containing protein n=1 Tax=Boletus edulis BED1 TaxID=1328754 RepID=A0AAD4BJP1_BOLED|nr:hypothetical protein L210DRAFT_3558561 [Boletus edulis BED1]